MKQKILVTGGAGYIGSHTVVELQQSGFEVIIVDNLSNSQKSVINSIEKITGIKPGFEELDLCDSVKLESFLKKHPDIKGIIHFAAYKAVGESVNNPLKYYRNNLVSLINLLEIAKKEEIDVNFVFSSSCTVYGEPDKLPVDENAPVKKAMSPYGNTKQIAEEILYDTVQSERNLKVIALRYFNPIGAHESGLIGELPIGPPDNLVPFITQTAAGIRSQLSVFGNDYNTLDGTCIRDYIYVVDLAKAHVIALKRLLDNRNITPYEVFNLGTGTGNTVLEVIKSFEQVTGNKLNYTITKRRAGDIEKVWADTQRANDILGWTAEKDLLPKKI
ncbi:MAG: UDP-glucose 4-epimerase GalE [Chlorobi bacterium]|nr:UDP-glucose 4-epimerase GalE [Chlorobiota bacterium]